MIISPLKKGFELSDKINTIQLFPNEKEINTKSPFVITKDSSNVNSGIFKISTSGEYELADIVVQGYKILDTIDQSADLFRISIEGVDVLWVAPDVHTISKDIVESIGNISIILFDTDAQILSEKKMEIANEFDPYFVVVNGNSEGAELFEKFIQTESEMKKLKVKADEFTTVDDSVNAKFVILK